MKAARSWWPWATKGSSAPSGGVPGPAGSHAAPEGFQDPPIDRRRLPHEEGRWEVSPGLTVGWRQRYRRTGPDSSTLVGAPQRAANPAFPNGSDIDLTDGVGGRCPALLPQFPGKLGLYEVRCATCGLSVALTSAGRTDDAKAVRVPC